MAVTQYIGARYVPLFADPAEWSKDNTYEPLTIVLYQGASYTSVQSVPKGIEIDNTHYWACTGNYNAQVEMYRKDVARFHQELLAEIERATGAEKTLTDNLAAEIDRATRAEQAQSTNLYKEVSRAKESEKTLTDNLATEVSRATGAENTLTTNLSKEITRATTEENTLRGIINEEITRATTEENTLRGIINEEITRAKDIDQTLTLGIENIFKFKNIVLIGDSYGNGYTPDGNVTSWTTLISNTFNAIGNKKVFVSTRGGSGFSTALTSKYSDLITSAATSMSATEKQETGIVYIGGGFNDWNQDIANIKNGIDSTFTNIKRNFPNAILMCDWFGKGVTGLSTGIHSVFNMQTMGNTYIQTTNYLVEKGFNCAKNSVNVLSNNEYFSSDFVHPNAKGQKVIYEHVYNRLTCGNSYIHKGRQIAFNNMLQISTTEMPFGVYIQPAKFINYIDVTVNSIELNGDNSIKIVTDKCSSSLQPAQSLYLPCTCIIKDSAYKYYDCTGTLELKIDSNRQLSLYLHPIKTSNDTAGYLTINNVIQVIVSFCSSILDTNPDNY